MKKLLRTRYSNVIGGVCGGFANYMGIDPVIMRIIFAALLFSPLPIFIFYIICWIVIPKEPKLY